MRQQIASCHRFHLQQNCSRVIRNISVYSGLAVNSRKNMQNLFGSSITNYFMARVCLCVYQEEFGPLASVENFEDTNFF